ncbi:MAG: hypothetical protein RQ745_06150 [Longimicrobiales bacterium]|nr:hypothetical protein [Longimicrobiales bacterium]
MRDGRTLFEGGERALAGLLLFGTLLAGCGPDAGESTEVTTLLRDSAGVLISETRGLPSGVPEWRLADEPSLELGRAETPDDPHLFRVWAAFRSGDGARWAVLSAGLGGVVVYDSVGTFLRQVGRPGEGPGDLNGVWGMWGCGADTVAVAESGRVSFFTLDGAYVSSTPHSRIPPSSLGGAIEVQGVSADCRHLFLIDATMPNPPAVGEVGAVAGAASWFDRDRELRSAEVHFERSQTLGRKVTVTPWMTTFLLPWGRSTSWTTAGDLVYLGDGSSPVIEAFDLGGRLRRRIVWEATPPIIGRRDEARYDRLRARMIAIYPDREEWVPELRQVSVPETRPFYVDALAGDDGYLWVQEYPEWAGGLNDILDTGDASDPPGRWLIFDPKGRLTATVKVPADYEVLSVAGDEVVAVWKDDLDVEYVRVHAIERPGGASRE